MCKTRAVAGLVNPGECQKWSILYTKHVVCCMHMCKIGWSHGSMNKTRYPIKIQPRRKRGQNVFSNHEANSWQHSHKTCDIKPHATRYALVEKSRQSPVVVTEKIVHLPRLRIVCWVSIAEVHVSIHDLGRIQQLGEQGEHLCSQTRTVNASMKRSAFQVKGGKTYHTSR